MYAIRSYYEHWDRDRNDSGRELLLAAQRWLGSAVTEFQIHGWRYSVITSYSIHYTKLYEAGGAFDGNRGGALFEPDRVRGVAAIFVYLTVIGSIVQLAVLPELRGDTRQIVQIIILGVVV